MLSTRTVVLVVGLASALGACGGAAGTTGGDGPAHPPPGTAEVVLEVPITFEVADGRRLEAPMVAAEVEGAETRLIIDGGSTHHLVTSELASDRGMRTRPAGDGGMPRVDAMTLRVGDLERTVDDALVLAGAPHFADLGVGGFLAAQRLVDGASVLLDLPGRRLLALRGDDDAVGRWFAEQYGDPLAMEASGGRPATELLAPMGVGGLGFAGGGAVVPGLGFDAGAAGAADASRCVVLMPRPGAKRLLVRCAGD